MGQVQEYRHLDHGYRPRLKMNFPTERSQVVGQCGCRDIRIDQLVHIVKQEAPLVQLDADLGFEPILQQRQRTWSRKQFRENSPEK